MDRGRGHRGGHDGGNPSKEGVPVVVQPSAFWRSWLFVQFKNIPVQHFKRIFVSVLTRMAFESGNIRDSGSG